jgi:hypothetical protein
MHDSDGFISTTPSALPAAEPVSHLSGRILLFSKCDEDACCSEMQKSLPLPSSYNAYNIT